MDGQTPEEAQWRKKRCARKDGHNEKFNAPLFINLRCYKPSSEEVKEGIKYLNLKLKEKLEIYMQVSVA